MTSALPVVITKWLRVQEVVVTTVILVLLANSQTVQSQEIALYLQCQFWIASSPRQKLHLSRKCQVEKPSTSTMKHKTGTANSTDPKSVSPTKRVAEFPGECLSVRRGKLFCTACREELALKKALSRNTLKLVASINKPRNELHEKMHENKTSPRVLELMTKRVNQQAHNFQWKKEWIVSNKSR